ncbi:unnamed protein product [Caenorhabditis auriculariae]|uniref:Uncharacterized protein n=1 Tax=Caenorhabditis auriculariae TaxID=2777116 RepID=A0A8S1GYS5_9PELO|nr:unnamed protein product [Caenorhabditis auriculariae]
MDPCVYESPLSFRLGKPSRSAAIIMSIYLTAGACFGRGLRRRRLFPAHARLAVEILPCFSPSPLIDPGLDDDEKPLEKDILVIPNRFPKRLNFFCDPKNDLMRDRLCMGEVDAFAIACADDSPPLQLVPFCLGYKHQCAKANFPNDEWCEKEFDHYRGYCTRFPKKTCRSCSYDFTCVCEPFDCFWRRYGFETARWCQKYELVCDEKKRREKGTELVQLMQDSIRVHYRCLHLFNVPQVICDPFSTRFDWPRCMKFLFDCELVSEWKEDEPEEVVEQVVHKQLINKASTPEDPNFFQRTDQILGKGVTLDTLKEAKKIEDAEKQVQQLLASQGGAPAPVVKPKVPFIKS